MNKHRSYLSIHIYTFRYDCCDHCNWHHFFFLCSQNWHTLKCPERSLSLVGMWCFTPFQTDVGWCTLTWKLSKEATSSFFFWLDSSLWSVELDYFNSDELRKKHPLSMANDSHGDTTQHFNRTNMKQSEAVKRGMVITRKFKGGCPFIPAWTSPGPAANEECLTREETLS